MEIQVNYRHELTGAFGDPISENPTGLMQEAAFEALSMKWRYLLLHIPASNLEQAVQAARVLGFRGFNCTIPHKVEVLKFLDRVAGDAALMGAVNTVRREGDNFIGENTDGKGFIRSLREDAGIEPAGKRIIILGAGGAARAMCVELALSGAETITVVNRSLQRGRDLVDLLREKTKVNADFIPWTEKFTLPPQTDILANATSIGLYPNIADKPDLNYDSIRSTMVVCDVIPNPPQTPFLREAQVRGAKTLDGLGMLVYQGAIAFKMWTEKDAPLGAMRKALHLAFDLKD